MRLFFDFNKGLESEISFNYAESFFTSFAVVDGKIYLWDYHCQRIEKNAHYFKIELTKNWAEFVLKQIAKLNINFARCRLSFSKESKYSELFSLEVHQLPVAKKWKLRIKEIIPSSVDSILKVGDYQIQFDAMTKLQQQGFDDYLFINQKSKNVLETSIANVVFKFNEEWVTPTLGPGILDGVLRKFLIDQNIVKERNISLAEIKNFSHGFALNCVRGIFPLESIEQFTYSGRGYESFKELEDAWKKRNSIKLIN
ncbi:MAG: hypothetical protein Fur0010_03000 [Bdellovibrio sp.]